MPSFVSHLTCPRCGNRHAPGVPLNLCSCGSPLLVDYDLEAVRGTVTREAITVRPPDMWRYRELLPVGDPADVVSLGEGGTPLLRPAALGALLGLPGLLVKDDGLNPTGTFKARGASCGISMARALRIREVALPSAGNAGAAWACYGAAAGVTVHVAMPRDAPAAARLECELYGADLTLVDGLISDAGKAIAKRIAEHGWFDASTLKEPYRIEGKKTLGLEIAEQLEWRAPDAIVYPAGGGVGIIGIWRAFAQLSALGWVEGPPPRLIVTQAEGCAPLVRAFAEGKDAADYWEGAATIAAGLCVPAALGDFLVLRAVRETGGTAVAVSDDAIREAAALLGREAGISAAPEGAATLAAAIALQERGDLAGDDTVVLVNTGSALKYLGLL
ncbi:MAG TPA: threonine synthase [Gaiellaceae bacterium]|nr:threonine synthase [Gaiellaceae bacterium]